MTGHEMIAARAALGRLWGLPRPLNRTELGFALGYGAHQRPGQNVSRWEKGVEIPEPVAILIELYKLGFTPDGGVLIAPDRRVGPPAPERSARVQEVATVAERLLDAVSRVVEA